MPTHTHVCTYTVYLCKQIAGWINQGPQPIALLQQEAKFSWSLVPSNTPHRFNFTDSPRPIILSKISTTALMPRPHKYLRGS